MIREYGNKGKCWSTYLQYCLEHKTLKFHSSLELEEQENHAIREKMKSMIEANLSMSSDMQRNPYVYHESEFGSKIAQSQVTTQQDLFTHQTSHKTEFSEHMASRKDYGDRHCGDNDKSEY